MLAAPPLGVGASALCYCFFSYEKKKKKKDKIMKLQTTTSEAIHAKFHHEPVATKLSAYRTVCELVVSERTAVGEAFCSKCDSFKKSVGRKLALARALQEMFPLPQLPTLSDEELNMMTDDEFSEYLDAKKLKDKNKDFRRDIWREYLKTTASGGIEI